MAKKKQKGNGARTVYPPKNKDGKVIGYRGSYYTTDGKRRYVSVTRKSECEKALRLTRLPVNRQLHTAYALYGEEWSRHSVAVYSLLYKMC